MSNCYNENDLVYGESFQPSMFESEKRTSQKSVFHIETDVENIKLGAPVKIASFDNFQDTTTNNSCKEMVVYKNPPLINFASHTHPLSDEATRMAASPNAQEEILKQKFKKNGESGKSESNGKKGKTSGKKVPNAKASA
jgi:hypothetical protein